MLKELIEKRARLARELVALANSETFGEAEQKKYDDMKAEISALDAKIDRAREAAKIDAETPVAPKEQSMGRVAKPRGDDDSLNITDMRNAADTDAARGYKTPREFLREVVDATMTGRIPERLRSLRTVGSDEQSGFSNPYGGFTIPSAFLPNLMSVAAEADPVSSRVTQVPMQATKVELLARVDKNHTSSVSGGIRFYRREEAGSLTSSRMQFERVSLNALSLAGLSYATEEILTDSPLSFAAILEQGFRDEYSAHMLNERLNGTGVGECEGILNSAALVTVDKETQQAATTINYTNIIKMFARCWGDPGKMVWLCNHDTLPQLATLSLAVGTGGGAVWMQSAQAGTPSTLLGIPVVFTEFCKTLGTVGDIVLCNWSQYLDGLYQGLQGAESMHVRFETNERAFRFIARNDGKCWWRSALTPKNSSSTLSPFVALATRS